MRYSRSLASIALCAAALLSAGAEAALGDINTVAGGGTGAGDGAAATRAAFNQAQGVALDQSGNLYVADFGDHRIRKITPAGVISTVAGTGVAGLSGDGGSASAARINKPSRVVVDGAGNVFFTDAGNHRVRKVDTQGVITTVAGSIATPLGSTDIGDGGPATAATLRDPAGIAVDSAGRIYIGDWGNWRVRRVAGGIIQTVAGSGQFGPFLPSGDGGPALQAPNLSASAIVLDIVGGFYFSDASGGRIRHVSDTGIINTVRQFPFPTSGFAVDPMGNFYVTAFDGTGRVLKAATDGTITTFAGTGLQGFSGDGGPATAARLNAAIDVARDPSGRLYIADRDNHRIRRVGLDGIIDTVAGNGDDIWIGDHRLGTEALLAAPSSTAVAPSGALYIADTDHLRIRRLDSTGTITTVAGNGTPGYGPDGAQATSAALRNPTGMAFDAAGNLFFVEGFHYRVRKLDTAGVLTTVAGIGTAGFSGDGGPATAAELLQPTTVALDGAGNLYIADTGNRRVRMVDTAGNITTIAGNGSGTPVAIDGAVATAVAVDPRGLAVGGGGELYISDASNRVLKLIAGGHLVVVAGGGTSTAEGVPATQAALPGPEGIAVDGDGTLYIALRSSFQVRAVDPQGFIHTVAGTMAVRGSTGDGGPATAATLDDPVAVSWAPGNIFITDRSAGRIRSVSLASPPGPITVSPASIDFGGQSMKTTSNAITVTLTNTSGATVSVDGVSANRSFAAIHSCATLAPGAACAAAVTFTPIAQGSVGGTLTVRSGAAIQTVALSGIGERSLATHYYRAILRRAPESGGKAFWDGEATRLASLGANPNETWFAMANAFFFSPEYVAFNRNDTEYVTDLYKTFFNRAPDTGGLAYWSNQLASGLPREVLLASFMFSPEFAEFTQAIFGAVSARAEVDLVMDFYRGMLSRLPDNDGLTYWVRRFRAAQCAATVHVEIENIASQFANGSEYLARARTNAQYVGDLYNAYMRRGGDLAGVQSWLGRLASGELTRESVRRLFTQGVEYQLRAARVASQGCLP